MKPPRSFRFLVPAVVAMLTFSGSTPSAGSPAATPDIVKTFTKPLPQSQNVTLITGDTVRVDRDANGRYRTSVTVAPRPDHRPVVVQTLVDKEHIYVLPSDAAELIAAGTLDRRLFDVRKLLADGYGDTATGALPVIVSFGQSAGANSPNSANSAGSANSANSTGSARRSRNDLQARASALPSSTRVRPLPGVNGAGAAITKKSAARFWSAVAPSARSRTLGAGLSNLWLDAKVSAALDTSVPLIGAPQAWAAGFDGSGVKVAVLDTGIDATHPDFAGKPISSKSFVAGVDSAVDGHGHGTHVASTILGSGAASSGRYKGVAPGARLSVGKVLDDGGNGESSSIIEAMEWAAVTEDADVINMSLGSSGPSDGTDPMSLAVDELSASTGALFVISAGNSGPYARTVSAPGAASSALTVAAFSKSGTLAGFSSRGPLVNSYALKPDIAAPGVDIAAARAAGTALGGDVDNPRYTTASGTSMAAPHVAGAAAILAQQRPDWTAGQLKAALMSTSRDGGFTAYEQGAGRVDIAAATKTKVVSVTPSLDFGRLRHPQTGPPLTRTAGFRNTGTSAVTLNLAAAFAQPSSPQSMLSVSPATLQVPAGGTAEAVVTLDPAAGATGLYSGAVTATGDGVSLRVPVGAFKEPPGFELTTEVVAKTGVARHAQGFVAARRTDTEGGEWIFLAPGTSAHLYQGVYNVSTTVVWADVPGAFNHQATLVDPQVTLDRDATVTLDANQARPIEFDAGKPLENYGSTSNIWHVPEGSQTPFGLVSWTPYDVSTWATPTERVTVGKFYYDHTHVVGSPMIEASAGSLKLHPFYQHYAVFVSKLDGRRDLPLTDVGKGTEADFAKVNVKGKAVLLSIGAEFFAAEWSGPVGEAIRRAKEKGAAAVFGYSDTGRALTEPGFPGVPQLYPLPLVGLPAEEGMALKEKLRRGPVTLRVDSRPHIEDLYTLSYVDEQAIPGTLGHRLRDDELVTIRHQSHSDNPVAQSQFWNAVRQDILRLDGFTESFRAVALQDMIGRVRRTERIGPISDKALWARYTNFNDLASVLENLNHTPANEVLYLDRYDVFDRPSRRAENWGESPNVPGAVVFSSSVASLVTAENGGACAACRFTGIDPSGDVLPLFTVTTDGDASKGELTTYSVNSLNPGAASRDEWHLYSGGTELPQSSFTGIPGVMPYYVLPKGPGTYRLTQSFDNWKPGLGSRAETAWTFKSVDPTAKEIPPGYQALDLCADRCRTEPLLFLRYKLGLGHDNRMSAPGVHLFTVTAYHQASLAKQPSIAGLKVSASFDGGTRWISAPVVPAGDGNFSVLLLHPTLRGPAGTTGKVSLRTEAWDSAGNRVVQTLPDAYGLIKRY